MEQRFLITEISRWNRPDPAFLHDPSLVLKQKEDLVAYHYVDNCPLTYLDPNGERKNWFVQKLKSAYRWSRKNVFHTGRINQKNLRDPNFQKHTRKFVTVTAPKAMKAVIEAMFVAEAVAGARLAYQGWKFARMGAKALAKGGAGAAKTGGTAGSAGGGSSKVDNALDMIKKSGAKVKVNPKSAGQEGNVTLQYRSGTKVNLRVESHPLGGSTEPVRHGNVEVIKNINGKNVKKMNIHITE